MDNQKLYDEVLHEQGQPFLTHHIEDVANLNHKKNPAFRRLTVLCAVGNGYMMYHLAEFFERYSRIKGASPFYVRASNYWRYRAYLKGYKLAVKWFTNFFAEHPGEQLESILYEYPVAGFGSHEITGTMLNDLGFWFFDSERTYYFKSCQNDVVIVVGSYESYDSGDNDGFGREDYYDWWFLDENMQSIPNVCKINTSSGGNKLLEELAEERAKAEKIVLGRRNITKSQKRE